LTAESDWLARYAAPLVSVIIPVFNGERFLGAAIDSVLAQAQMPIEIIVVDDGSTDDSAAVAEAYGAPVRCLRQPNAGPGSARNRAMEAARGEYLAFLDADDLWTEDKLALQLARLQADTSLDGVFGLVDHFIEPGAERFEAAVQAGATGPVPGTLLIRRDSFRRVGRFELELRVGEFIEWYGRAIEAGLRFETLQQVVLLRRIHGENTTIRLAGDRSAYLRIMREALNRRRTRTD
jgi:glycosyltransferase involved in cell wall biosynthesis